MRPLPEPPSPPHKPRQQRWPQLAGLAAYQSPILSRSLGQLASTLLPYFALIAAMYASLHVAIWLTFVLALPAELVKRTRYSSPFSLELAVNE